MTTFDLLIDPWVSTSQGLASLLDLTANPARYQAITEAPLTRHAVLRLLLAIGASMDNQPQPGEMLLRATDDRPGFLQTTGLPTEGRTPWAILSLQDANNAALSPLSDSRPCTDPDLARALVTAFFCDRGGLKAQVKGLPISGAKPLHMGQLIAWKQGKNLEDFLNLNAIEGSDWVPWWKRPVDYDEPWDGSTLHYLMWPWRRLQVNQGSVTIAAGVGFKGNVPHMRGGGSGESGGSGSALSDPWAVGRAGLKHVYGKVKLSDLVTEPGDWSVSGLMLNQATPVAWIEISA